MRRIIYIILLLLLFLIEAVSQQSPAFSQYMLNGFLLNPAVAGSEGYTALNLTVREQWVGLTDGPSTYAVSFQTRLMKESQISRSASVKKDEKAAEKGGRVGLGGYIFTHRNGAVNRTGMKFTYSYHIDLEKAQLSFGLSMAGYQYSLDEDKIKLEVPDDDLWLGIHQSVFIPDADVGVYLSTRDYWLGFSVDQLLESAIKFGDEGYESLTMERNYNLLGGYDFQVNRDVIISPSTYIKLTGNGRMQVDISTKCYFKQNFWGGLTYRTGSSIIVMAGVSVDRFVFGYSYDIGLNSLIKDSYGTHEFTFVAKLGDVASRYRWLNRY
jgi:type IX secretion system PorP/SprF family membrane protein